MKLYLTAEAANITTSNATAILTAVETAGLVCLELMVNNAGFEVLKMKK